MGLRDQIEEANELGAKVKELEKIRKETEELRSQLEEMSGEVDETLGAQIKESKDLLTEMVTLLKNTTRAIRPNPAESAKETMQALNKIVQGLQGVQKEAADAKSAVASTKEEAKAAEGIASLATKKMDEARWGERITTAIWAATAMLLTLVIGTAIVWSTSSLSRKYIPQDLRMTEQEMETIEQARRERRAYQGLTEQERQQVDKMMRRGMERIENQESR
jgi:hypothetical protein